MIAVVHRGYPISILHSARRVGCGGARRRRDRGIVDLIVNREEDLPHAHSVDNLDATPILRLNRVRLGHLIR